MIFMSTICMHLVIRCFCASASYQQQRLLRFYYTQLSPVTSAFFRFACIWNGFWWNLGEVITTTTSRWIDYIFWRNCTMDIGTGYNRINIKLVLPHSELLHKLHSTYGLLHPQAGMSITPCSGRGIIWLYAIFSSLVVSFSNECYRIHSSLITSCTAF